MSLNHDHIRVMRLALGMTHDGTAYRNHYITHETNPAAAIWRELIARGYATFEPHSQMALYRVTDFGRAALIEAESKGEQS